MDDKELRALLDDEARAAEEARDVGDGAPLAPHVKVSRPNRAKLNPED